MVLPAIVVSDDTNKAREVLEFNSGLTRKSIQFSSVRSKCLLLTALEKEPWVIDDAGELPLTWLLCPSNRAETKMRDVLSSSRENNKCWGKIISLINK